MRNILFAALSLIGVHLAAQQNRPYFQQEVHYNIAVTLYDTSHFLRGNISFEYINHSPDTLRDIWLNLWGNAYKDSRSAFCKQKLRDADGRYYFSSPEDRGYFEGLDFKVNGNKAAWNFDPKNPDIGVIHLKEPLLPGGKIQVSTPLNLKIPASFSRLGHVGTSYQVTQWFPKPAVYDRLGWHAMPYLDVGEFYSEFGSFDVTLTLPENYVVGASGVLQTPSEMAFLQQKERETRQKLSMSGNGGFKIKQHRTDPFPASSAKMKTIRYIAEKVHDFAWFADKRFMVLKDTARLASGKTVDCWAMFTNSDSSLWVKGAFYVRRAVEFYSAHVGEYPWPQATAVHSALSAGGGMEYPMITVIGPSSDAQDLDDVITHEVGHNWFYGFLGSNEREHPFMDEGINTYYETRYMHEYYKTYVPFELPKFLLDEEKQGSVTENGYLLLARNHDDTPPDTHSNNFNPIAYALQVYSKTGFCMKWLEKSVGTEKFDAAMHEYYRRWIFKHPYPEDFRAVLNENGLKADWLMDALQTQKQVDYKLTSVRPSKKIQSGESSIKNESGYQLGIKNKGRLLSPFSVTALEHGKEVATRWYTAQDLERNHSVFFAVDSADAFEIDWQRVTLDLNRRNNFRRTGGLFPGMRPWEYRPLALFENSHKTTLAVLPWIGWNNYDKTMLGVMLFQPPMPSRRLQYYFAPGYGLGSKQLVGIADLHYHLYPGGLLRKLTVGISGKTFDYDHNFGDDYYLKYRRLVPYLRAELAGSTISFKHTLSLRALFIQKEEDLRSLEGRYLGNHWKNSQIYELRYEGRQQALPNPFQYQVSLESNQYTDAFGAAAHNLRSSLEWKQQFYYKQKAKISLRLFAGYFLENTQRHKSVDENSLSLNPQSFNDYKFDYNYLYRSGADNFLGRRANLNEGGFKGAFGSAYAAAFGNSNNFILAMNLKADLPKRLPMKLPIKPYFDLGYYDDATTLGQNRPFSEQLAWNGGLMLEFGKGVFEVYFPLVYSKNLKDLYCEQAGGNNSSALFCGGNYAKMISFSFNLKLNDPAKLIEQLAR